MKTTFNYTKSKSISFFSFSFRKNHRLHLIQKINVSKLYESSFSFTNLLQMLCYKEHE